MTDLDLILDTARAWSPAPMALATVVSTWGSAPRPRGSHLLVHRDGRFEGSVSGGCVEGEILQAAAEIVETGGFRLLDYGVADESAWQVGLPCGGKISVLVQRIGADGFPSTLFDEIAAARADGRTVTVATDLSTGVSQPGASGDFVNRYDPPRRLIVVGAVQIAQALASLARTIGIRPVIVDPRGRFLTEERFPGSELDDRWPDEAVAARQPGPATAVVTLSHDIKIDDPALMAALSAPTGYVAALGSRRSHAARLERLTAAGFGRDDLARIVGPAGIDIGAIGPAEIALSIAAGMVRRFNDRG